MSENTVKITKDGLESEVVESAFHKVWEPRGWTLVEDESSEVVSEPRTAQAQPDTSGTGKTQDKE